MCIFTLILIIVSIISSSYAIKVFNNNDPKEVVIDEVAGYFVSVLFLPFDYNLIIIAFILFRLFDIYKPFLDEIQASIENQGRNDSIKQSANEFLEKSIESRYSYNFTWLGRPIIQYPQDILRYLW